MPALVEDRYVVAQDCCRNNGVRRLSLCIRCLYAALTNICSSPRVSFCLWSSPKEVRCHFSLLKSTPEKVCTLKIDHCFLLLKQLLSIYKLSTKLSGIYNYIMPCILYAWHVALSLPVRAKQSCTHVIVGGKSI